MIRKQIVMGIIILKISTQIIFKNIKISEKILHIKKLFYVSE